MPSERAPELAEVIRRAIEAKLSEVHVSMPARVVKVDTSTKPPKVHLQPLVKRAWLDESGVRQVASLPVIPSVPVLLPGGGPFRLTMPLSDGSLVVDGDKIPATMGTAYFAECSLDRWLSGKGEEVDPEIDHGFALADGIFVPGLHTFASPLASYPADHATLGHDSGVQLHLHKGSVVIADDEVTAKAVGLDGDEVDLGTWQATFGAGPLSACIISISITPPGGGPPVVLAVATPGPFPVKGKLVASASQLKAK